MAESSPTLSFPITLTHEHRLIFTRDVFAPENLTLAQVLTPREPGEKVRALVFWDGGLEHAFPGFAAKITRWFAARGDIVRLAAEPVGLEGGERVKNEVSIVMGFDVKPDSSPKAEIGAAGFEMVAKGANLWVKNAAEEGQFIEALRKGQRLVVKAVSKKGNATTDSYTLAGLLPALERIGKDCQ